MKYKVEIKEILLKKIDIEAENIKEAKVNAKKLYNDKKIILDSKDIIATDIKVFDDNLSINLQQMWNAAQMYEKAAERCEKMYNTSVNIIDFLPFPVILNRAFACEVCLKILNIQEDHNAKYIHYLDTLFNSLSQNLKNEIKAMVNNQNFDNEIEKHRNVLSDVRYFYELEELDINMAFIKNLHDALMKITEQLMDKKTEK